MFNKKKFLSLSLIILAVFLVSFFLQTDSAKAVACDNSIDNHCRINHNITAFTVNAYNHTYTLANSSSLASQDTFIPLGSETEWNEFKLFHPDHITISEIYTLTYSSTPGCSIFGTTPQTVVHGGSGEQVEALVLKDYGFTGWSDGVSTLNRTDINVTSDINVTANCLKTGLIIVPK
jgi:hypothetical protein